MLPCARRKSVYPTPADRCSCSSSTIARSFSAELEDIFRIDNSVADLDAKLDERCVTPKPVLMVWS